MNSENTDRNVREEACPEIRLLTAKEALRLELRPIEVPENAELLLSQPTPNMLLLRSDPSRILRRSPNAWVRSAQTGRGQSAPGDGRG